MSLDRILYAGPTRAPARSVCASGFDKWGSDSIGLAGVVARAIAAPSPGDPGVSPRHGMASVGRAQAVGPRGYTLKGFADRLLDVPDGPDRPARRPGRGGQVGGKRRGAYRDEQGQYPWSARAAPHMGLRAEVNLSERTGTASWLSFDYEGPRLLDQSVHRVHRPRLEPSREPQPAPRLRELKPPLIPLVPRASGIVPWSILPVAGRGLGVLVKRRLPLDVGAARAVYSFWSASEGGWARQSPRCGPARRRSSDAGGPCPPPGSRHISCRHPPEPPDPGRRGLAPALGIGGAPAPDRTGQSPVDPTPSCPSRPSPRALGRGADLTAMPAGA